MRCFFLFLGFASSLFSEKIVSGILGGGLGNQMFLAATIYAYALDIEAEAIFPNTYVDHVGSSPVLSKLKRFDGPMPALPIIQEVWFRPIELPSNQTQSVCLSGFFQSARYFHHRRKEILELFGAPEEIKQDLILTYGSILKKNTVAIHIRRGDYLHFLGENAQTIMYNLSEDNEYYKKALQYFNPEEDVFLIFSDDIEFTKKMSVFQNLQHRFYIEGQAADRDLYLMSLCKHQIMSNSTFSWWGAYLCEYPNQKVVFPMRWFGPGLPSYVGPQEKDGYCKANSYTPMDHWIKIE